MILFQQRRAPIMRSDLPLPRYVLLGSQHHIIYCTRAPPPTHPTHRHPPPTNLHHKNKDEDKEKNKRRTSPAAVLPGHPAHRYPPMPPSKLLKPRALLTRGTKNDRIHPRLLASQPSSPFAAIIALPASSISILISQRRSHHCPSQPSSHSQR